MILAAGSIAKAVGIKGFIAIGLAIALGVVMWRADAISEDRERIRNALATEKANHAVTRQSVQTLADKIAELNREANARADAFEAAKRAAAAETERLRELAEGSDARIARLREMAERPATAGCEAPADLLSELEGL